MKSYGFLFWAYTLIWIGLAGYVAYLVTRIGRVQRTLSAVERRLASGDAQRSSDS